MSCTVRAVPPIVPVTFDRPTRGAYATSTSPMRQPARPRAQHHLERPAEAAIDDPEREQVGAPGRRIGPRSRRRTTGAAPELGGERRGSRRARATATRPVRRAARAEHEVGVARRRPARRRARGRAPSNEPSQSMKHTTSCGRRARGPAKHAAPNPRCGSATTTAPRARAIVGGAVGRTVVDDDRVVAGRECAATTPGIAAASSRAGSTTSACVDERTDARRFATVAAPYDSRNSRRRTGIARRRAPRAVVTLQPMLDVRARTRTSATRARSRSGPG